MPTGDRIEALIARVENGEFVAAIEEFYTDDATMQENLAALRAGLPALVANEKRVLAAFEKTRARCVRPVFVQGDQAVIHWLFEFTAADGKAVRLEELAHQRWRGDRIAEERFFYDPVQLQPQ
ncbi:MAG TPA: nuclear transport factor 2 family protein [Myxococcota bacterium]|nr:nuclear transport factor 2 family protein [Myxococcota bacterium]